MNEILEMFKENFPYVSREEDDLMKVLGNEGNVILTRRTPEGKLVGCAVVNKNTILLLVVDKGYRGQGIGDGLLRECEAIIRKGGHQKVVLGVGFDYLMPGVPTSRRYAPASHENLDPLLDTTASDFFEKRGYKHSWGDCNCFDMRLNLDDYQSDDHSIGDTIDDILYRWATMDDLEGIVICADDACQYQEESFSRYYRNENLYANGSDQRVLVAVKDGRIVGTLIVSMERESKGMGNVGCTCVATDMTHQKIGTTLVCLGTGQLKEVGLKKAQLSYTYSGLDILYGASGYEVCTYYFMGEKELFSQS